MEWIRGNDYRKRSVQNVGSNQAGVLAFAEKLVCFFQLDDDHFVIQAAATMARLPF